MKPHPFHRTDPRNSFGLVGDGDDIDLIETAESVFGIQISDHDAGTLNCFGTLLDLIESKISLPQSPVCLLRRTWQDIVRQAGQRISPNTHLSTTGTAREAWLAALQRRDNPPRRDPLDVLAGSAVLVIIAPFVMQQRWTMLAFAGLALALWTLTLALQTQLLNRQTLGQILRHQFHQHYADQSRKHGHGNPRDRWLALEALCRDVTGHSGPVERDTTFFPRTNRNPGRP
ncbi:MAG: hypothetical protein H7245_05285 [Candidatus Saccharibacteria bacterium]|nr:hypothetical protein [Pseudorhodobacter sp.]